MTPAEIMRLEAVKSQVMVPTQTFDVESPLHIHHFSLIENDEPNNYYSLLRSYNPWNSLLLLTFLFTQHDLFQIHPPKTEHYKSDFFPFKS